MHRSIAAAALIGLIFGLLGTWASGQLSGNAGAAPPPPATQPVREQNLDGSGFIRVHEQGTANVAGTVSVGNLPVDGNGNVRVVGVATPVTGRLVSVASNVTIQTSSSFTSPYFDSADCRRFVLFTEMSGADSVAVDLVLSPDGNTRFGAVRAAGRVGDLQHGTWVFDALGGAGEPATPWAAFEFENLSGSVLTVENATLYCSP